ncbi:GNAT family N-acetyltransferase [Microbacterium sp. Yaish 1]|uniref:GNAT family N-acetyltransferase n=1 Tax=Microbacterium sp. Yaish 1 TaxID=2025014 RepID=UPI000B93C7DD|nr:GNAT family N-acetyltransferase [Microbacterium sp. Yaish 1]OYC97347.1 GNAT family N-acetyltransferase [Microbacterium sp. Yaish 1]
MTPDRPLPPGYTLHTTPPSVADYVALRAESGLSPKTPAQAAAAIAGTWAFRRVADADGRSVAMGRIVGDGGWYFLVADMATLPAHQGNGFGSLILDELLAEIRDRADEGAYITLTADPPGRRLYESRGFTDVAPARTGMSMVLRTARPEA